MIVVCGEALVDLVPEPGGTGYLARPGGSPANVAAALGRLGVPVSLLARLSTDHFGQIIRGHLRESHVDLSLAFDTDRRSTVAMVTLESNGDAGYEFSIEGGADADWRADTLPPLPGDAVALHLSGALALAIPTMGDAMESLLRREHGQRVLSFDPNPRPLLSSDVTELRERMRRWMRYADIVKVSEEDLSWTFPDQGPRQFAEHWLAPGPYPERDGVDGPALVVVTRGGDGVVAVTAAGAIELPAMAVDLVDTVGAGDAFMAGLLASCHRSAALTRPALVALDLASLQQHVQYAQRVAAITCGRRGADPPWLADLDSA